MRITTFGTIISKSHQSPQYKTAQRTLGYRMCVVGLGINEWVILMMTVVVVRMVVKFLRY